MIFSCSQVFPRDLGHVVGGVFTVAARYMGLLQDLVPFRAYHVFPSCRIGNNLDMSLQAGNKYWPLSV